MWARWDKFVLKPTPIRSVHPTPPRRYHPGMYDPAKAKPHNGLPEPGAVRVTPEETRRMVEEFRARMKESARKWPRKGKKKG